MSSLDTMYGLPNGEKPESNQEKMRVLLQWARDKLYTSLECAECSSGLTDDHPHVAPIIAELLDREVPFLQINYRSCSPPVCNDIEANIADGILEAANNKGRQYGFYVQGMMPVLPLCYNEVIPLKKWESGEAKLVKTKNYYSKIEGDLRECEVDPDFFMERVLLVSDVYGRGLGSENLQHNNVVSLGDQNRGCVINLLNFRRILHMPTKLASKDYDNPDPTMPLLPVLVDWTKFTNQEMAQLATIAVNPKEHKLEARAFKELFMELLGRKRLS